MLHVENLSIELDTRRGPARAVRNLNLRLERGATLGIVGESGSGKSMTALALLGLLPENARMTGSIRFQGEELVNARDKRLCQLRGNRISMIFQEPMTTLNPVHTVGAQVAEPLRLHLGLSARVARGRAIELLERVGIANAAQRFGAYPHQFSGGQRQRITIAMALACAPDLLIADEPTTALDVSVQQQILSLLRQLVQERGMAMILISHDLGVVTQNVQKMLVMYGGCAVEYGPTQAVFARMAHPYTQGLLAARPLLLGGVEKRRVRLATIAGTVPELHDLPAGCTFAGRCPQELPQCAGQVPQATLVNTDHWAHCWQLESINKRGTL